MEILIVGGGYIGMYTARRLERLLRRGEVTVTVVDPPNAQHAIRQSKVLARNIVAFGRGGQLKSYRHAYAGSVAGLGHHQGVAQIYQIQLTGFVGWLAHRIHHLFRVPTLNQKARVLADWTLTLFFRRETAQLTPLEHPADDSRTRSAPLRHQMGSSWHEQQEPWGAADHSMP